MISKCSWMIVRYGGREGREGRGGRREGEGGGKGREEGRGGRREGEGGGKGREEGRGGSGEVSSAHMLTYLCTHVGEHSHDCWLQTCGAHQGQGGGVGKAAVLVL